jgi:hypothetical protein
MALVLKDRVLETASAPGTGAVTLLGAVLGYQTFSAGVGDANTCYYTIADQSGANWEVGIGTYSTSGNILTRTTLISSSTGSTVNFSSGTQNVFVTYPAEKAVYLDAAGQATLSGQLNLTNASDFNLYASGAGSNYMAGKVGIGANTPYNNVQVLLNGVVSAPTTFSYGLLNTTTASSGTTTDFFGVYSQLNTLATTLTNANHYIANQGTFSGTVTNQFAYLAQSTLTSASNNYGFYGNIPLGTTRTISFVNRTTNVVTITTSVAHGYTLGQSVTVNATTNTSVNGTFVIASVPTSTTFTYAQTGADIALVADTGSTVVVNRWNFYANGSAPNYFGGSVGIGTISPNTNLEVVAVNPSSTARSNTTTGAAIVGAYDSAFYTTPSYRGVYLMQYGSTATGTTAGYSNAGLGTLAFQNTANALIYTNGGSPIVFATLAIERMRISAAGTISLGAAAGSESLRVTPVASAVNYVSAFGAVTGQMPTVSAQGSDTNIPFGTSSKGTSPLSFYTNAFGSLQFNIAHTATAVNYLQVTGAATGGNPVLGAQGSNTDIGIAYITKGIGVHAFYSGGGGQFAIANTASSVNYLQVTGSSTGNNVVISSNGSDTNVSLSFIPKGAGELAFFGSPVTFYSLGNPQFKSVGTASTVNYLQVTGAATGSSPSMSAVGSDTNIDLNLISKGTGVITFGTYTAGTIAQAGYITIKDAGGTSRRLLVG